MEIEEEELDREFEMKLDGLIKMAILKDEIGIQLQFDEEYPGFEKNAGALIKHGGWERCKFVVGEPTEISNCLETSMMKRLEKPIKKYFRYGEEYWDKRVILSGYGAIEFDGSFFGDIEIDPKNPICTFELVDEGEDLLMQTRISC